jgi:hypothetical protein
MSTDRHDMTRHYSIARLTLALLALLALAGPAAAKGQKKQVPLRGQFDGIAAVTPLTPPFLAVNIEGGGHATQLGNFDVFIPNVTDFSNGTAVGTYLFTAANGETLTADFILHFDPAKAPGVASVVVTATITGGTGRFAGATGSFVGDRIADTVTGIVTIPRRDDLDSPLRQGLRRQSQ